MKKIIALLIIAITMASCYEEYITDYLYDAIYFPYQTDVRTFVVGEGMKFEVGAALAGVRDNTRDRSVSFILDNTLVTPAMRELLYFSDRKYVTDALASVPVISQMPSNYVSLSNSNTMVIKTGTYSGTIVVRADSTNFLNDSVKTRIATYVLPFKLTNADADSLLKKKNYNVIGVIFENMLYGNYWHGGQALVNRPSLSDTTIKYFTTVPAASESKVWSLKTVGPSTLSVNGYFSADITPNPQMKLVLKGNNLILSAASGSAFAFTQEGPCTFNRSRLLQERKLFLKYRFTNTVTGYTYHCTDTLSFRNRLRDGINEWYDENPSHYKK
jgi:hypothetical protein